MSRHNDSLVRYLSGCSLCAIASALIAASFGARSATHEPHSALIDGVPEARCLGVNTEPVAVPGYMYVGVSSCTGEGCHSEEKPTEQGGKMIGDESTIWSDHDPHHRGFDTLCDEDSDAIAVKLGMEEGEAPDSPRCLSCHATYVPEPQRGERFDMEIGVGCETCHGPGEKYLEPHATEGWTNEQRGKIGAEGLLKEYGLIDTTNLAGRATMCVSCHLQIDKDMLDAGHPALQFEMYSYNYYIYNSNGDQIHWDDSKIPWINAKLWAVGQAAALDGARRQVDQWKSRQWDTTAADALVTIYQAGTSIAKKHFGADTPAGLAGATYSADACKGAATDLAALAATATTKVQRRNLGFGMTALGEAYFNATAGAVPDAFWAASTPATAGEDGPAWEKAIKDMADLINK